MIALLAAAIGFANLAPDVAQTAAVTHSPDVAGASARIDQSVAALAANRDGIVPSILANYAQIPQGNPPGPNVVSRIVTIGLQSTVNDFFAYGATVRAGVLALVGARADYDVAVRTERVKTVGLYYDALRDRGIARAREHALELAGRALDAAKTRFGAGDAPRLDVLRADVAVAKATADLEAARATDQNSTEALRVETGLPANADLDATIDDAPPSNLGASAARATRATIPAGTRGDGTFATPVASPTPDRPSSGSPTATNASASPNTAASAASTADPSSPGRAAAPSSTSLPIADSSSSGSASTTAGATVDAAAIGASALKLRAEVASADAGVSAALATRSAASAAGLPAIVASAGVASGTDSGVPIGGPSVNVSMTIPVGGASADKLHQQGAVVAEARAKSAAARRAVLLEVTATARSIGSLQRAAAASTRARIGADAELAATELGYRSGASSSFELASARDVDTQARIDELAAQYDLAKARATLQLEIGR